MNLVKKIYLLFLILIPLPALCNDANQETIVVYCDYHGVAAEKKKLKMAKKAAKLWWNNPQDSGLFIEALGYSVVKRLMGAKLSISDILNHAPKLRKYEKELYHLATLEKPIVGTLETLKKLKEQKNVVLVLASNMTEDSFEYNKRTKPEIFGLFDYYYIASPENGEKPDLKYYHGMCEIEKQIPNLKNVKRFFLDDKQSNVLGARKANLGIHGIRFKNSAQLVKKFIRIGLLKQ